MNHHAYLVEGDSSLFNALTKAVRAMFNVPSGPSPDFIERYHEKFGIENSRSYIELASLRGLGTTTLIVIGVASITTEAQQSLLKLFEEPREGLTFVLLAPRGMIISTLRSRMMAFPTELDSKTKKNNEAAEFLGASPKVRSEILAKILKKDDARERLRNLADQIEYDLCKTNGPERYEALAEIAIMRRYLSDRAPSLKMIFEHLAVSLPTL